MHIFFFNMSKERRTPQNLLQHLIMNQLLFPSASLCKNIPPAFLHEPKEKEIYHFPKRKHELLLVPSVAVREMEAEHWSCGLLGNYTAPPLIIQAHLQLLFPDSRRKRRMACAFPRMQERILGFCALTGAIGSVPTTLESTLFHRWWWHKQRPTQIA